MWHEKHGIAQRIQQELGEAAHIRPKGLSLKCVKTTSINYCSNQKGRFMNCLKYNSEEDLFQI